MSFNLGNNREHTDQHGKGQTNILQPLQRISNIIIEYKPEYRFRVVECITSCSCITVGGGTLCSSVGGCMSYLCLQDGILEL